MIITCAQCDTAFNLDDHLVKATGSKVRCSKCQSIFVAYPEAPATVLSDADDPTEQDVQLEKETTPSEIVSPEDTRQEVPEIESEVFEEDREAELADTEMETEQLEGFEFSDIDKMLITDGESRPEEKGRLEFDEEEFALDVEPIIEPKDFATEPEIEFEEPLEIEISAIETPPETEEPIIPESPVEEAQEIEAFELDFEPTLETEIEAGQPAIEIEETSEIDFSEIEQMAEMDVTPTVETEKETESDDEAFELDFEPVLEIEEDESPRGPELEPSTEIDFAEIEKMADISTESAEETKPEEIAEEGGLVLDFSLGLEDSEGAEADKPETESDSDFELELPEFDEIIEADEVRPPSEEIPDELELEFDSDVGLEVEDKFGGEQDMAALGEEVRKIDEFEDTIVEEEAAEAEMADAEVDLEYEIEEDQPPIDETVDYPASEIEPGAFTDGGAEIKAKPKETITAFAKPPKKRIGAPILALLIIVLIGAGGYAAYTVLNMMNIKIPYISDIKIPFISDFLKTPAKDAENLQITTIDLSSKFVENSKAGRLFVVTGKVKNDYSKSRSFIRVTGKLFAKAKTPVKIETISCGNVLSELELASLDITEIKNRLANRFGDKRSNLKVKPGQTLAFMIVFSDFPDNIEEFTIEIAGSSPV